MRKIFSNPVLFVAFCAFLFWSSSCALKKKAAGLTTVVVEVIFSPEAEAPEGAAPTANDKRDILRETALVCQARLKARDITLVSIDTLLESGQLRIQYEGAWPQDQMASLFVRPGRLELLNTYGATELRPVLEKVQTYFALKGEGFELSSLLLPAPEQMTAATNSPLAGYSRPENRSTIDSLFRQPEVQALIPADMHFYWSTSLLEGTEMYEWVAIRAASNGLAPISNVHIASAEAFISDHDIHPMVDLSMTEKGSNIWASMTERAVGKHLAIVLDKVVFSYPMVNSKIMGGRSVIPTKLTYEETENLAAVVSTHPLPRPVVIRSFQVVVPESQD